MTEQPDVEKDAPTCRACYAATLTPDERTRFFAEGVTSCIYLCPEHKAADDRMIAAIDWSVIQVAPRSNEPRYYLGGPNA